MKFQIIKPLPNAVGDDRKRLGVPKADSNPGGIGGQTEYVKPVVASPTIKYTGINRTEQGADLIGASIGVVLIAKDGGKTFFERVVLLCPEYGGGIANLYALA